MMMIESLKIRCLKEAVEALLPVFDDPDVFVAIQQLEEMISVEELTEGGPAK